VSSLSGCEPLTTGGGGYTPAAVLVPKTKPSGVCSSAQFVHCLGGEHLGVGFGVHFFLPANQP